MPIAVSEDMLRWLSSRNCKIHPGSFELKKPEHKQQTKTAAAAAAAKNKKELQHILQPLHLEVIRDKRQTQIQNKKHSRSISTARAATQKRPMKPREFTYTPRKVQWKIATTCMRGVSHKTRTACRDGCTESPRERPVRSRSCCG